MMGNVTRAICGFCSKRAADVATLVVGPSSMICDECVDVCAAIVAEKRGAAPELFAEAEEARIREIMAGNP